MFGTKLHDEWSGQRSAITDYHRGVDMEYVVRLALLLSLVLPLTTAAQVQIRLTQPPPNQLRVADLWKVDLINRTQAPVRVTLHATAEELSIPDGLIVEAFTAVVTVPPGTYRVTGRDVQPIRTDNENPRYRDALLLTGAVPTGEYRICCEVLDAETEQILGTDCKVVTINRMSVPVLITPPDESEVPDKLPVFSWMSSVPPGPAQRITYELVVAEMFAGQSAFDAVKRNPAHLRAENLARTVYQYPISARALEPGRRYAWMVLAKEITSRTSITLGESEVWSFTYVPFDVTGRGPGANDGRNDAGGARPRPTPTPGRDGDCPGENWDFELGTLACWTADGDAWDGQPVRDDHPVLGDLGHHRTYWLTSYGAALADKATGLLFSEEFPLKTSGIGFLAGGALSATVRVEALVEKFPKDTFKLETRSLPGSPKEYWVAATTTAPRATPRATTPVAGMSERLVPVEWDVRRFLNRAVRIAIVDQSKTGHINVDNIRFYDLEKLDTVKQPVLLMAAGERHSLVATPEKKPDFKIRDNLKADIGNITKGGFTIDDDVVVGPVDLPLKGASKQAMADYATKAPKIGNLAAMPDDNETSMVDLTAFAKENTKKKALALAALPSQNIVWGWGMNLARPIGQPGAAAVPVPRTIAGLRNVQALAGGMEHSVAATQDGKLYSLGLNDYHQAGTNDDAGRTVLTPTLLSTNSAIVAVAAGHRHSMALTKEGKVLAWGYNGNGEAGLGITVNTDPTTGQVRNVVHVKAPFPLLGKQPVFAALAAGGSHSAAVTIAGDVYCWGVNMYGQCGRDDDTTTIDEPMKVPGVKKSEQAIAMGKTYLHMGAISVACGDFHTVALLYDGTVRAWGSNASGQLGNGTTKDSHRPVEVKGLAGIRAIAAGSTFTVALDSAGRVWAWGNNSIGQLGTGDRRGRFEPVQVSRLDAVVGIAAGGAHALAVRADGGLWTWGTNGEGQLGEGPVASLVPVPFQPPLGPHRVEALATAP
ncbi:MAG: hypothetical protein MUC47_01840 [Candidatus Kapabacteria bacterium]|nr:hypothetical protein [Candidatus Kapabacteria bacterium]